MLPDPLRPGPADVEDLLARRPCPEPAGDFRARVLAAMADARDQPVTKVAARRWWAAARAAAAVVLALNLGMSAANGVRYHRLTAAGGTEPAFVRWPGAWEAGDPKDRFERVAARALARLHAAPDAGPTGVDLFSKKENREWGTP